MAASHHQVIPVLTTQDSQTSNSGLLGEAAPVETKRRSWSINQLFGRRSGSFGRSSSFGRDKKQSLINPEDHTQHECFLAPEDVKQYRVFRGKPEREEVLLELSFDGVSVKTLDGEHTVEVYPYRKIPAFKSNELLKIFEFRYKQSDQSEEELISFQTNESELIRIMAGSFVHSVAREKQKEAAAKAAAEQQD